MALWIAWDDDGDNNTTIFNGKPHKIWWKNRSFLQNPPREASYWVTGGAYSRTRETVVPRSIGKALNMRPGDCVEIELKRKEK